MYLMIDNYDSFTFNLASYFRENGHEIFVIRNDCITIDEIRKIDNLEGIVISPGPGTPEDGGVSLDILKEFGQQLPILGVCLGHQIIGFNFNAKIIRGKQPMHGKVTTIEHDVCPLFDGIPKRLSVTRYHSLIVSDEAFPKELKIDARADDGVIMAISHKKYPIFGIQYHPEAVLTQYGHEILSNFTLIATQWNKKHKNNCLYIGE